MPDGMKMPGIEARPSSEVRPSPEAPKEGAVETRVEKAAPEQPVTSTEKERAQAPSAIPIPAGTPPPVQLQKTQLQQDIEDILADDLKDLYATLSPQQKLKFKQEGERTAAKIEVLLKNVTVKISEVLHLIRAWLGLLPGVNKYFLEKEVKIKTERILDLKEEEQEYK